MRTVTLSSPAGSRVVPSFQVRRGFSTEGRTSSIHRDADGFSNPRNNSPSHSRSRSNDAVDDAVSCEYALYTLLRHTCTVRETRTYRPITFHQPHNVCCVPMNVYRWHGRFSYAYLNYRKPVYYHYKYISPNVFTIHVYDLSIIFTPLIFFISRIINNKLLISQ